ncbi:MAG: M23 family metallopeptidase [Fibromonadales bacterium]|nr:M23 family metallopeptidase [Fibromonadales bacterium]
MKFVSTHISLEGSSVSMQLSFPKVLLLFINLFKRLAQLALLILVVNVFAYWTHKHFVDTAQEQRVQLYSRLENLNTKIDSIDAKISTSYVHEDLVYAKYGFSIPDTSMRKMGLGGLTSPDSALVWSVSPIKRLKTSITDRFKRIEAKIDRSNNSYLKLQSFIENVHGDLKHTPSILPVANGFLGSGFGYRTHPVTREANKMHYGLDISAPKWTTIYATANGRIETVATSETMGRYVAIDHGNGIVTRYGHMTLPFTKEGLMVSRGDVIGYIGSTGRSTGNHVHYEVWVKGTPVNPIHYILPDQYSVE